MLKIDYITIEPNKSSPARPYGSYVEALVLLTAMLALGLCLEMFGMCFVISGRSTADLNSFPQDTWVKQMGWDAEGGSSGGRGER